MSLRCLKLGYGQMLCLALAALTLANGGCLWIAAGATGGAAVGYAYAKGKVCGMFNASFGDTWQATRTALGELGMRIVKEERDGLTGFVESRTADGEHVRIYLRAQPSPFPADGEVTRACVRIATFGDRPVSERILDQIGLHLAPVRPFVPSPSAPTVNLGVEPASAGSSSSAPAGSTNQGQTTPPPLATPDGK